MNERLGSRGSRMAVLVIVLAASALPRAARADEQRGPLAGIVTAGKAPVAGIELLVHGLSAPIASFSRIVRTAADGTWVLPAAPAGLYAISSLAPGFLPAVTRVWHRAGATDVSFIALDLSRPGGVLPPSPLGASDPWIARAVTGGDVLREQGPSEAEAAAGVPARPVAPAALTASDVRFPVRASVSSLAGFGASNGANISGTSVDLAGTLGTSTRWGIAGQYRRLGGDGSGDLGDASRLTLDVAPGNQAIRVMARRQNVDGDREDPARFAAQGIDWSGAMGDTGRASVSARVVSESNLLKNGPAAALFARASNAFEVEAHYRKETGEGGFVRVAVGYRSATGIDVPLASSALFDRETRVGGSAGLQITDALSLEGGATGDVSNSVRGVTPELTITLRTADGIRIFGFAARRFERHVADELPLARAGTDESGLARLSRTIYRAGVLWEDRQGGGASLEVSQREMVGTYRLLLDPDFFDTLDSLYFLEGDVAREVAASGTFRINAALQARLAARSGWAEGDRQGAITHDRARYSVAEAAVRVGATGTTAGVSWRVVSQELVQSEALLRNDLSAIDLTLAQSLPIPFLRVLGSDWRVLFSLEIAKRQEGDTEARLNRRFSGGLALAF